MRHFSFISQTPTAGLLCDTYPPQAAFSLRKLRSAATLCIRVRRSSDNTEQDIGFSGDFLDASALTTFCSGTDGFVKTWYDQSGNSFDITQATTGNQPRIVSGGTIDTVSSNYAVKFISTDTLERSNLSAFNVGNAWSYYHVTAASGASSVGVVFCTSTTTADRVVTFCDNRATPNRNLIVQNSGGTSYNCDMSTARTAANQNRYLSGFSTTGKALSTFDNGATGGTATYTGTYTNNTFKVGAQHLNQTPLVGFIQEIIIYASDTSSDRTSIESNIATYYSI